MWTSLDSATSTEAPSRLRSSRISTMRWAKMGAMPSLGSSSSNSRVPRISARAKATYFCCPPDRVVAPRRRNSSTSGMRR